MIHKEGYKIISIILLIFVVINIIVSSYILLVVSILLICFLLSFFRIPRRKCTHQSDVVYAPADGKIVAIEETIEKEYLKDKRIQVSIFMSIWNVHINWYPINGIIKFFKYHPGKFLIARNPKSSEENERTTIVLETKHKIELVIRQIAGAVARRIKHYVNENKEVNQGEELGFIKFGSRVDVFFPLGTDIKIKLNQKVKGKKTIIAELKGY